jgi:hypothetical protein
MKTLTSTAIILLFSFLSFAATITVNNRPQGVAMYTNLQTAIYGASIGDTILIHNSGTSYGNIILDKTLHLMGEGYLNSTTSLARLTQVGSITFKDTVVNASGSSIRSLYTGLISGTIVKATVDNVTIEDCFHFQNYTDPVIQVCGNDWVINRCKSNTAGYGTQLHIYGYQIRVSNSYYYGIYALSGSTTPSAIIENCVVTTIGSSVHNMLIQNTMILSTVSGSYIVFNHCVFKTQTEANITGNSNQITNCLFSTDPLFVNTTHFQPLGHSPLKRAGSDGSDIGITGGAYIVTKFDGENKLPKIDNYIIKTAVIKPADPVIIQFEASRK